MSRAVPRFHIGRNVGNGDPQAPAATALGFTKDSVIEVASSRRWSLQRQGAQVDATLFGLRHLLTGDRRPLWSPLPAKCGMPWYAGRSRSPYRAPFLTQTSKTVPTALKRAVARWLMRTTTTGSGEPLVLLRDDDVLPMRLSRVPRNRRRSRRSNDQRCPPRGI